MASRPGKHVGPAAAQHARLCIHEGNAAAQSGRWPEAVSLFERAVEIVGDQPEVLAKLSLARAYAGDLLAAWETMKRALRAAPDSVSLRVQASVVALKVARLDDALAQAEHAARLGPGDADAATALARALLIHGRRDEAVERLLPVIGGERPPARAIEQFARAAGGTASAARAIELCEAALTRGDLIPPQRSALGHRLGELLHGIGAYERAFAAYTAANAVYAGRFDAAGHRAAARRVIDGWTAADLRPDSGLTDERAVFIVGVPRSGTTLVEQILGAHPACRAIGETAALPTAVYRDLAASEPPFGYCATPGRLDPARLAAGGRSVMDLLGTLARDRSVARIVEKGLANTFHVGAALRMLPAARFVVIRRDPLDTIVSCLTHDFGLSQPFTKDQGDCASYIADAAEAQDRWLSLAPDRVYVCEYRRLVSEPEAAIRDLLGFVGLSFDERCLRSHETARSNTHSADQVRRPITTAALDRWRVYEQYLDGARRVLAERGLLA